MLSGRESAYLFVELRQLRLGSILDRHGVYEWVRVKRCCKVLKLRGV